MYSLLDRQPCWFLMLNKTHTHTHTHKSTEREREREREREVYDANLSMLSNEVDYCMTQYHGEGTLGVACILKFILLVCSWSMVFLLYHLRMKENHSSNSQNNNKL